MELLSKILDNSNILVAFKRVVSNKGGAGVDGLRTTELSAYMQRNWTRIREEILRGNYQPQAVLGVSIPKSNGGERLLGIPSVLDRLLQQAILQVIAPLFDIGFSNFSYGFRKGYNAHQAVLQSQSYINEGYQEVIDLDLKDFFDIVNQDYLMSLLHRKISDTRLLQLIRRYLQSDLLLGGLSQQRSKGTPQGSPLSPLLSNIILDVLDKELSKRGHRFIRYADDCSIFVRSKRAAERVLCSIRRFINVKLHLQVNEEKTAICRPLRYTVLGYGFIPSYEKGVKGKYRLSVSSQSFKRLKQRIKQISRKTTSISFTARLSQLRAFTRGWVNYYKFASMGTKLKKIDSWVRSRLRYCIWKQWKKPNKRKRSFMRLGIRQGQAYAWSRSRMGGWAIALSPIMKTTITVERLQRRGYLSFSAQFQKSFRLPPNGTQTRLSFV